MAPLPITEDYYMVLEVEETATPELIISSYRRLALKLHPDRNAKHNATEAFQLLGEAYETLKDESKRQVYDKIYPSIRRRPSPQKTQIPHSPSVSNSHPGIFNEAAQIAALQKSKQERCARWRTSKYAFDSAIFELQRGIRRFEQEIKNLDSIFAAEAAAEAQKNSWTRWVLSPIYRMAEDSEEEKERKDRERQERRIEKDMKERRLESKKANLKTEQDLSRVAQESFDAADLIDDRKIQNIHANIRAREYRENQERVKLENERRANFLREQQEQREKIAQEAAEALRKQRAAEQKRWEEQREKIAQEAAEALRKQRAAEQKRWEEQREKIAQEAAEALRKQRAAEQKRWEEEVRKYQNRNDAKIKTRRERDQFTNPYFSEGSTRQDCTSTCRHDGWWPKIQGRTACPKCYASWSYLLQCPGCEIKACPKCQAAIRPRMPRNAARTKLKNPPRVRTPSPDYEYNYY